MSYFQIDRRPPPVHAPDAGAISRLDDVLAARAGEERRRTSLQTCHRPRLEAKPIAYTGDSNAFVPQFSARILNDPALTDGARRCAAKLMELTYRQNRRQRALSCTVSYLAKGLGRSERAVQNYLRQLRAGGYVRHEVVRSERARMCVGIFITLLAPLFPRHHRNAWPAHVKKAGTPGVNLDSDNYSRKNNRTRFQARMSVEAWAWRCMDGVYRAFMKSSALVPLPAQPT
jgi:hypothetical protein